MIIDQLRSAGLVVSLLSGCHSVGGTGQDPGQDAGTDAELVIVNEDSVPSPAARTLLRRSSRVHPPAFTRTSVRSRTRTTR